MTDQTILWKTYDAEEIADMERDVLEALQYFNMDGGRYRVHVEWLSDDCTGGEDGEVDVGSSGYVVDCSDECRSFYSERCKQF